MPGQARATPVHHDVLAEPSSLRADAARYAVAAIVVVTVGAAAAWWTSRAAPDQQDATEIDSAITVDLPPAEASSQPASDAPDGPEQQAAQATVAQASMARAAPQQQTKPEAQATPAEAAKPMEEPPPPVQPDPPAVLERKLDELTPPPVIAAPPTTAREERAPTGSATPGTSDAVDDSEERPHASAHAITVWQRALLRRLQEARRMLGAAALPAGTVKVAFEIDGTGALTSEHVASGSGSPPLDRAALQLVRLAAPFPAPPPGSGRHDRSFIIPVRFR